MMFARFGLGTALVASLFLFMMQPVRAADSSEFKQGVQSFRRGNFDQAAQHFERARRAGMHTSALLYNLGVSYYRLGRYDQARRYFLELTHDPSMAPLAWYNLAVVADRQGHRDEARSYLQTVLRDAHDQKLRDLAHVQMAKLHATGTGWRGFISTYAGYDDNVSIAPTGTAAGPDEYLSVFAYTQNLVSGTSSRGLLFAGSLYTRQYASLAGYNLNSLRLEARRLTRWGDRFVWYGAYLGTSTFGGAPFQNTLGLQSDARWRLGHWKELRLHYRFEDISSLNSAYNYLQGWRQQLRVEERSHSGARKLRLIYEFELNDRQDQTTASFSPMRNTVRAVYELPLGGSWSAIGDLALRVSDYPQVATQNRHDLRLRALLAVSRKLGVSSNLQLRYRRINNQSTDPQYQYVSNRFELRYSWFY